MKDLIEEILTSRYMFFEKIQPFKCLKDYKYFSDDYIFEN